MLPLLPALLAVVGSAHAHPFDATFHGHQLEVGLEGEEVRVAYLVEVPTVDALADLERFLEDVERPGPEHQAAYTARVLEELVGGLEIRVDGEPVSLERVETPAPSGVGDRRFITFRVELEGALPPGARTLHVINANFPGERALYSNQAWVDDAVRVHDTDLVELRDGRVTKDEGGRWLAGEDKRELRLSFTRVGTAARWVRGQRRRWVDPEASALIPARQALVADPPGLVRRAVDAEVGPAGPAAAAALSGLVEAGPAAVALGLGAGALGVGAPVATGGLLLGLLLIGVGGLLGLPPVAMGLGCAASCILSLGLSRARPGGARMLLGLAAALLPAGAALRCVMEGQLLDPGLGATLVGAAWVGPGALVLLSWGLGRAWLRGRPRVAPAALVGAAVAAVAGSIYWIP
jgi:hypothetical protein